MTNDVGTSFFLYLLAISIEMCIQIFNLLTGLPLFLLSCRGLYMCIFFIRSVAGKYFLVFCELPFHSIDTAL